MKIKLIVGFASAMLFIGCTFSSNKIISNGYPDKVDAEFVTKDFFKYQKSNDIKSTIGLFSSDFIKKNGKDHLIRLINDNKSKLGSLKKISLEKWETKVVKGSNSSSYYFLVFNTEYENCGAKESFQMTKGFLGKLKITEYKLDLK